VSWTQGVQEVKELPQVIQDHFAKYATETTRAEVMVWDTCVPNHIHIDYYNTKTNKYEFSKSFILNMDKLNESS